MIKITIGDMVLECSTAQEAAELATLMQQKRQNVTKPIAAYGIIRPPAIISEVKNFVNQLRGLNTNSVSSAGLADALQIESVNGLGPRLRGLSKQFEAVYHRPLEEVLVREGPVGQLGRWRINRELLENID